jgi:hypothetical protein
MNNNKTECQFCGQTSHPSFKCAQRKPREKTCFVCGSGSHLKIDCDQFTKQVPQKQPVMPGGHHDQAHEELKSCDQTQRQFQHERNNQVPKHSTPQNKATMALAQKETESDQKLILGASNCVGMSVDDPNVEVLAESGCEQCRPTIG